MRVCLNPRFDGAFLNFEMIENKNNIEHRDGFGATLKRVGDRLWISNYYGGVGGVANLISDGTKNNTIVAEALVEVN